MSVNVVTFPIGVRSNTPQIGIYVPAVVSYAISKAMRGECTVALNILDSWKEDRGRYVQPYIEGLQSMSLKPDLIWIDGEHTQELFEKIRDLRNKGFILEENPIIRVCKCGKVHILESTPIHRRARVYDINIYGEAECNYCQSRLESKRLKSLVFRSKNYLSDAPLSYPSSMSKRVQELWGKISSMEYLISRTRDTGLTLRIDGQSYSLDVDSCWLQYLACLPGERLIIVGSNHVAWHLCLASAYLKCLSPRRKIELVLTPYVRSGSDISGMICDNDLPLYILLNMTWSRHETKWSAHSIKLLDRTSQLRKSLYFQDLENCSCSSLTDAMRAISPIELTKYLKVV